MISIFPASATDFSSNGLCALTPSSCLVNETLNGEWELDLVHPLDDRDKWSWLQVGNIIKAPVPASMTPRVRTLVLQSTEGNDVYRISTSGGKLNLWSRATRSSPSLAKYKNGLEVQVISTANPSFYEVVTPDGKHGYMGSEYLLFVRTLSSSTLVTGEIVEPRQLREQPFRIYRIVPELTQVTVYARHLFYDLMDNMIYAYKPAKGTAGAVVAEGIVSACQSSHMFNMFSNITETVDDLVLENTNPVEALLGEGGLVDKSGGELARDWYDIFAIKRVGKDTDIQIRQGKNLLGISYDVDDANVVTRIVPTGENEDGSILYLDEKYLDSPNVNLYPHPRWIHLPVSEAKVGDDLSLAQAKDKLRAAAQAEYDKGCDLPDISIDVDFISVADTQEYADYKPLTDIFLGDSVRVIVKTLGLEVALRMTEYSYDCLLKRYAKMTLGMASETVAGSLISSRQLPVGGIKGMKLAMGSIGTGHLQTASIGSLQVKTAAIGSAHIQSAAIDTAHIQDASILTAKIADAQITSAKIAQASIQTANIADAAITNAKIGTAAIKTANIEDATVSSAKIGATAIQTAHIADAAITSAKICTAAIQTANIADAAITSAKIGTAEIKTANIEDLSVTAAKIKFGTITYAHIAEATIDSANIRDAAITSAKIANAAIDSAKIVELAVTDAHIANAAISTAKIHDAAITSVKIFDGAITRAKIAQAAVGTAEIDNAAITSAKIGLAAIETEHIGTGVVGTEQVADGSITDAKIVSLTANKITAGTIDAGTINVVNLNAANITVGTINGAQIAPNAIGTQHIGAGVLTSDMFANGALSGSKISIGSIAAERLKLSTHMLY